MIKNTGGIFGLVGCLFASGTGSTVSVATAAFILSQPAISVSADAPKIEKGAVVTLSGTLKKGMMAIGGETTGWVLEYDSEAGMETIQLDPTNLKPDKIPEGSVTVKGEIVERSYAESGPTLVLKATKIKPKRVKGA